MESKPAHAKVLLVEDDLMFRDVLLTCLAQKGYTATGVGNTALAKNAIALQSPDFVITDLELPGESGLELLEWIRSDYPAVQVVLMTGFTDLHKSLDAAKAGAAGFLAKPFRQEELFSLLDKLWAQHQSPAAPTESVSEEAEDFQYCKVSIEDFIRGSQIKHSIFIRPPSTHRERYLKIAHNGEDPSPERIQTYKAKGVSHLYLTKPDYQEYLGLNVTVAGLATRSDKISVEKKTRFVRHTLELMNQQLSGLDIDREDYGSAATLVETSVSLLSSNDDGFKLLESLKSFSDEFYAHGAAVSMICTLVGRKSGWSSPVVLYKASMAGLLHDIGKKQLPKALLLKKRAEMDADERTVYETHPLRGMEILSDLGFIPSDVTQAVYQHHERAMGTGFPNRLPENKIIPLAKIVGLVDEFVQILLPQGKFEGVQVTMALERLRTFSAGMQSKDMLKALFAVFKVPYSDERS